tara:strand:- start:107 stop:283 length:177 start_codon:yes stop_codon:yes gene_type:complete
VKSSFIFVRFFQNEIELIDEEEELADEARLAKDCLEVLTVFSSCLYGKRAQRKKDVHA